MRTLPKLMFALALCTSPAWAFDQEAEKAAGNATSILNDKDAMNKLAIENPNAAKAMEQIKNLNADAHQKTEFNQLSSDIFNNILEANKDDPAAVQAQLERAMKDPTGFMMSLPPEQQARLKSLASQLEKNGKAPAAPQIK